MLHKILVILLIVIGVSQAQRPGTSEDYRPRNMDAVRIWKLTEVLELTEEQTVTFLPQVQIQERKLRKLQNELQKVNEEGRLLLESGNLSSKDVDKLLKSFTAKQDEIHEVRTDFIKSLPKYLSPEQQLLYIGFEARFKRELRAYMKDRRDNKNDMRRPERP